MEDRRKIQRDRALLGGRIAFHNRCFTIDCLVRNISHAGARIAFSSAVAVPDKFDFIVSQDGQSRKARIAWRDKKEAGIVFLHANAEAPVPLDFAQKIRKLEADRAALAQRVAQLSEPA